jgi:hypothetical protein
VTAPGARGPAAPKAASLPEGLSPSPHARRMLADPSEVSRPVLLTGEQVAWLSAAAQALDFLAELEEQIGEGGALDVAWDADPRATRETAAELREIVNGWRARDGGLFAGTA